MAKRIFSFIMAVLLFVSCPLSVYASDEHPWEGGLGLQLYYNLDDVKQYIKETKDFWVYAVHQLGAIVKSDFTTFMNNSDKFDELCGDNKVGLYKDDAGTVKGVYLSKEFMAQLKTLLDEYAKENEPYKICQTYQSTKISIAKLGNQKNVYDTLNNLIKDSPSGVVAFAAGKGSTNDTAVMLYADIGSCFKDIGLVYAGGSAICSYLSIYDNDTWGRHYLDVYGVTLGVNDTAIVSGSEFIEKAGTNVIIEQGNDCNKFVSAPYINEYGNNPANWSLYAYANFLSNRTNKLGLVTRDGRRIRYYSTYADYTDYMLGRRSVYYTSNYYDYVPEDLTVSIEDLQKSIDDMQDVIDKLLDQITNDTSESEIEELLRQILEELRNQQGGGGGSGGGDVNVDIDLSTTNSLLSKILAKVTQIFDKMSETVEGTADTVHAKIQETLDEMLAQIKKLKHWTMADTVVGAADAVADWLDLLKDLFSGADDAAESVVGAISATMDDAAQLMKTKFPFCIPWDVYLIVGFLAEEPQTPVFRLPIKLERLGIEEYIEINLEDFEVVSSMSRTFLTLLYCYALLNLTMKVFPITKEGGD